MNLCRFSEQVVVSFKKSAGGVTSVFEPGRDYVLATAQFERICQDEKVKGALYKVSRLEPRLPGFNANVRKAGRQSVLFYNGSGGYGDQILSWPVAKWLADAGYEVHVLCDPGNHCCWYGFPWVKSIQAVPIAYELFKLFDYHFVVEHVNNTDEHPDQLHPVDTMFARMGVDFTKVEASRKVVEPVYTWSEQNSAKQGWRDKQRLGLFQLSAANPIRAMLPTDAAFMLLKVAKATPDIHWLALVDEFVPAVYADAVKCRKCGGKVVDAKGPVCPECNGGGTLAPNVQLHTSANLRELWALTKLRASVVVAPDSMMVHVAGCQGVPCVGVWGPVAPSHRVMYYKNHVAIHHQEACQHAPCFCYLGQFPRYCPPRGTERKVCEVIAAASPNEVVDAVVRIKR